VWRAFFFAVGTMLVIVGVECLLIDSATLKSKGAEAAQISNTAWLTSSQVSAQPTGRVVRPQEAHPWSLLASGAIVLLYSFTLPKRWGKSG
jgi:hypothetical protein